LTIFLFTNVATYVILIYVICYMLSYVVIYVCGDGRWEMDLKS